MMSPPRLAPLALARATLSLACAQAAAIGAVVASVSAFLDVSAIVRPPRAAASGSRRLVDRVVSHVLADAQLDAAWKSHWFSSAMEIALKNDDLATVKTIHAAHPESLAVRSLEVALAHTTLETVQWVVENRCDRLCCRPGVENLCRKCLESCMQFLGKRDAKRIVEWLSTEGLVELVNDSGKLIVKRWALAKKSVAISDTSPDADDVEIIRYLTDQKLPKKNLKLVARALCRDACNPELEEIVEAVIASPLCDDLRHRFVFAPTRPGGLKVLQWESHVLQKWGIATPFSTVAVAHGHLDTVRWLVDVHGIPIDESMGLHYIHGSEEDCVELLAWRVEQGCLSDSAAFTSMTLAAEKGYVEVIKYLYQIFKPSCILLIAIAAASGHLDIIQWLYENSADRSTREGLKLATEGGHLHVVQWLHAIENEGLALRSMVSATHFGQLEVLAWLYENEPGICPHCVYREARFAEPPLSTWKSGVPALHCLQWLESKRNEWAGGPFGRCIDPDWTIESDLFGYNGVRGDVALMGHLRRDVLECDVTEMANGALLSVDPHPGVLRWLHRKMPTIVNWTTVRDFAEMSGDADVLSVLDELDSQSGEQRLEGRGALWRLRNQDNDPLIA